MGRLEEQLGMATPAVVRLVEKVPLQDTPPLPPDWPRCEVQERSQVVRHAGITVGSTVLEIGSGG